MNFETWQRAVGSDGGSLWDVYVLGTNLDDWQRLLDWLRDSGLPLSFKRGGASETPPQDVGAAFVRRASDETCTLFIDPDRLRVNTHFFIEDEIELDLDPREVHSERELARLRELLIGIARLLSKTVLVTPENRQESPFFEINADGATRAHVS